MDTQHTKRFIITTTVEKKEELKNEVKKFIKKNDICVDELSSSVKNLENGIVKIKIKILYHNKIMVSEAGADRLIKTIISEELLEEAAKIII